MKRFEKHQIQLSEINGLDNGLLYRAALTALVAILAGNLLYPDTVIDLAWKLGPVSISPLRFLFVLTAPFILIYAWRYHRRLSFNIIDIFFMTTMIYMMTRGILAASNVNAAALTLGFTAYMLLLYYGTAVLVQKKMALKVIILTLTLVGFVVIALGIAEFFLERNVLYSGILNEGINPFSGKMYVRSGSTLGHPLALGLFLLQIAPLFMFFFARASSAATRVAWGVAVVALALTMLVAFSKGVWIAAFLIGSITAIWLLWRRPRARKLVILLFLAVSLSVASFSVVFHKKTSAGTISKVRKSETFKPRNYMWSRVPTVIRANPVFGVGMWQGGTEVTLVDYIDYGEYQPSAIDNLYLNLLVEQGILGTVLMMATLTLLFRQALALCKSGEENSDMAMVLIASMSGVLICGLVMDSLFLWSCMVVFWLVAGMLRSLHEIKKQELITVRLS